MLCSERGGEARVRVHEVGAQWLPQGRVQRRAGLRRARRSKSHPRLCPLAKRRGWREARTTRTGGGSHPGAAPEPLQRLFRGWVGPAAQITPRGPTRSDWGARGPARHLQCICSESAVGLAAAPAAFGQTHMFPFLCQDFPEGKKNDSFWMKTEPSLWLGQLARHRVFSCPFR